MIWLFSSDFEYRDHCYHFRDGDGLMYRLKPGEAGMIAFQLTVVLAMGVLGLIGWFAFSIFVYLHLHLSKAGPVSPSWLLDSSIIYPIVLSYWVVTWLVSCATWFGLSLWFSNREPEDDFNAMRPSEILMATKPVRTLAVAVFACAFVAQGFGDASVCFRGVGDCDFIKITRP